MSRMTWSPPAKAGRREWIGLAVLALPCLLVTMDLTVLFLAVPQLTADLEPSGTELLWITDAYGFLVAGALIVMGALGDRVGRRRVIVAGGAAFAAASALAAVAASPEMLIVARGLQGIAGATLLPSTMALVFNMFRDDTERTKALGAVMGCFALGAAVGPLFGGALIELFDWRAVFVPNLAVMGLLFVLAPRYVPEVRDPNARPVDVVSGLLSVGGVLASVYAVKHGARDGIEVASGAGLVVGVALLAAFARRQRRLESPLVDVRLFARGSFSTAVAAGAAGMFVTYGTFFFTSQHLQLVIGLSPLEAGLWGLPPVAAMMFASGALVPKLAARFRPAFVMAGGMLITSAGLLVLTQLGPDSGVGLLVPALVLVVIGLAPATTIGINLIVGSAPPEQAGSVSGLGQAANELGGALGIALLGAAGTAVYRDDVADAVGSGVTSGAADAARDTLGGAVSVAGQLPPDVLEAATSGFAHGLHVAAVAGAVIMAATAVATAIMLRHVPASAEAGPQAEPGAAGAAAPAPEPAPA